MRPQPPAGFYVYLLIDPRNGRPFYVGKGTGRRCYDHEAEAKGDRSQNPRKIQTILEIWAMGKAVRYAFPYTGLSETRALVRERQLIDRLSGLTNIHQPRGMRERVKAEARVLLAQMLPKEEWIAVRWPWGEELTEAEEVGLFRDLSELYEAIRGVLGRETVTEDAKPAVRQG